MTGTSIGGRRFLTAFALTSAALIAFAANSILCRMALGESSIDPYSFTAVRIGAGAIMLSFVGIWRRRPTDVVGGNWLGAAFLIGYALPFSMAYVRVDTGTGALLLFGAVQLTMIGRELVTGRRPGFLEWLGLFGGLVGVVYLVSPGVTAPDAIGAALMIAAGIGWAGYTITGKGMGDPALRTTGNFQRAVCFVIPVAAFAWPWLNLSPRGALLAALSGAVASGLGYAVWYAALEHLSLTRAALVQLAVPVLAAVGGVIVIGESITPRLVLSSALILGAIALGILGRSGGPVP